MQDIKHQADQAKYSVANNISTDCNAISLMCDKREWCRAASAQSSFRGCDSRLVNLPLCNILVCDKSEWRRAAFAQSSSRGCVSTDLTSTEL